MIPTMSSPTISIEDACERLIDYRGKTPPKTETGIRLITAKVIKDGEVLSEPAEYIAADYYDEWMRRGLPKCGDVLITTEAPLGEVALLKSDDKIALAQRVILLRAHPDRVLPRFLFYAVQSDFAKGELRARSSGTTVLGIKQSELRKVRVPHFELGKQRRIAAILSVYDDLIENNQRRIRILEEMARLIYREWFVNFRFTGHEKLPRVASPGDIPQGWEVVSIDDVCSRVTDGSHHSPKSVDEGLPMASSKDMHDWGLSLDTCRLISPEDFADLVRNDCKPKKNDVLITKDGANYLKFIFVTRAEQDVVLLSSVAMLRPNARINPHLLAAILKEPENKGRLKNYVTGAAIPRVILKDFKRFELLLPSKEVQTAWAKIAEPMTEQIWCLIATVRNLRRSRDLLLPKLMSGEIDVSKLPPPPATLAS